MAHLVARLGTLAFTILGAMSLVHCAVHAPPPSDPQPPAPSEIAKAGEPAPSAVEVAVTPPRAPDAYPAADETPAHTLKDQRLQLFSHMERELDLSADQLTTIKGIFEASPYLGQGNPAVSRHPMTPAECRQRREDAGLHASETRSPCGRTNMVPIYDPESGQTAADAKTCIDQYEFPNIPCEYPVVHVTAREAALICEAEGKRICDAHEWEGACAGDVRPVEQEYDFGKPRPEMMREHNTDREKRWAYGPNKNHALCGTDSAKTPGCPGGGWKECGSNTYPTGAFPQCVSSFGVYDQHGNAAEHMNLPLDASELASRGGHGQTEMKGSWFVFNKGEAHEDDCRWRAKDWHPSKLMAETSHENYHLGFRCCADVGGA